MDDKIAQFSSVTGACLAAVHAHDRQIQGGAEVPHKVQAARPGARCVLQRPLGRRTEHGVDQQAERALRQLQSVDTIPAMKNTLDTLRQQLATDTDYFRHVYNYTFEFSRPPGQRSLALDMAQGFWALLIPHGLMARMCGICSSSSCGRSTRGSRSTIRKPRGRRRLTTLSSTRGTGSQGTHSCKPERFRSIIARRLASGLFARHARVHQGGEADRITLRWNVAER
ncbi:hypothetical protein GY45DRAFT_377126 [Cubamyces sp. BRFM 1775]|nr:hypothetical protein GY45DRAFT_377126 [Cubamyces sp. BRFM 1775]